MPPLSRLYIEPTNCCNPTCRTCIRNIWGEEPGYMSQATFDRILAFLLTRLTVADRPALSQPGGNGGGSFFSADPGLAARLSAARVSAGTETLTAFFGGYGEPLAHPGIVDMLASAKSAGARVELITNGTLLTPELSRQIIAARLDRLWVSLDGARPESYADVRLGAELPQVLANLTAFRKARPVARRPTPEIGIAFVAMRRNVADLPDLLRLGARLGARYYMVTNVLPHTPEMCDEILYETALSDISYLQSSWVPAINLPKFDVDERTGNVFYQVLRSNHNVPFAGGNLGSANDRCPFVQGGRRPSAGTAVSALASTCCTSTSAISMGARATRSATWSATSPSGTCLICGTTRSTRPFAHAWSTSSFRPAPFVAAASYRWPMRPTARATHFPPVGAACGPRASSSAREDAERPPYHSPHRLSG